MHVMRKFAVVRSGLWGALGMGLATTALAADKSWNAGAGTWGQAGNWTPAGIPGVNDIVRIGNLPGVQNAIVSGAGATSIPAAIEISDGMTLDAAGVEFVGASLLVTISGDSRFIVRPHVGINQYDFIGEVNINPGAHLELTNNVPIRLYWDSYSWGRIEGWGEIQVNSMTPFNNSGVINPSNGGLRIEQGWSGNYLPFDLDGSSEIGQVWLTVPYSIFELNASNLTDSFDGAISMVSGTLLTMNIEDGWRLESGGVIGVNGSIANAAAQINGDDLTLAGTVNVAGEEGILRVLADATVDGASHYIFSGNRMEYDGATTVEDGWFRVYAGSTLDFDGVTTMRGGEFITNSTNPADGVVNFNGSTTWNGGGPVEISGVARQMGNAFVNGPMVINADLFDMDGDGDTQWTIWNDLTINADLAEAPDAYDTFTGTLDIAGTAGRLTVNVQPAYWDFHMSGEMNLIGHPSVYHTRYAGDTLTLHGVLNASGKVASDGYIWAYEGALNIADAGATLRLDGGCIIGLECAIGGDGEIRVGPGASYSALFPHANFGGVGLVNDGRMGVPGFANVDRFQQTATGEWTVFLRGYDAEDNDQLRVTGGDAQIDGSLEVEFAFDFKPVVGDEFVILTATGNIGGSFDANPKTYEEGKVYHWTVLYGTQNVTLRLGSVTDCPADLNADGKINQQDLAILLANYGIVEGADQPMGDINGDGAVDQADLAAMLAVYNSVCS